MDGREQRGCWAYTSSRFHMVLLLLLASLLLLLLLLGLPAEVAGVFSKGSLCMFLYKIEMS